MDTSLFGLGLWPHPKRHVLIQYITYCMHAHSITGTYESLRKSNWDDLTILKKTMYRVKKLDSDLKNVT